MLCSRASARRTIPGEAESEAEAHPGFDERLFVLSKKPTSVSNALDRAVERGDGVQVHSSFTLAAMRSCCHNATRAPARTFVFAALVALSLLGWGKLAATNVFDTLTQSVPVEDCAKVRKSGDETTAQRRAISAHSRESEKVASSLCSLYEEANLARAR